MMNTSSLARPDARASFSQVIVGLAGVTHVLTGLALLAAPAWFFAAIGTFPPFNRHYEGDLGAFILPLGLGLLWSARDLSRYRLLIVVAAGANLLHAINHIYDGLVGRAPLGHWLSDTGPLLVMAILLLLVVSRRPAE
jgi:hypothetical protein